MATANKVFFVSAAQIIEEKRASLANQTKNLRTIRAHRKELATQVRELNRICALGHKLINDQCNEYVYAIVGWDDKPQLHGSITLRNMLSLTDPTIGKMVHAFRTAGFERHGDIEKHASEYSAHMEMEFRRERNGIKYEMTLRSELAEDGTAGATCRKVQVGVEVKEVPKYEIVCG